MIIVLSLGILVGGFVIGFLPDQTTGVALYDTQGFQDPAKWKRITNTTHVFTNPEHILFENAFFRVTYPILRKDQQAGHSYWVKVRDEWMRVTGTEYGDYVYFIDSIRTPPEEITIVKNSPEEVILAFRHNHKNYHPDTTLKQFYKGDMVLTKTMSLKKGYPGVFVSLRSVPVNPPGEREIGFGVDSPLVFSEQVVAQHPVARQHVDLRFDKARQYYAVSLPLSNSFYRLLVLPSSMWTLSYQSKSQKMGGRLTVNRLVERNSHMYQAFLGAIPFNSSELRLEGETLFQQQEIVRDDPEAVGGHYANLSARQTLEASFNVDVSGDYRLVARIRSHAGASQLSGRIDAQDVFDMHIPQSDDFEHITLADRRHFTGGSHSLAITLKTGELALDNIVLLPLLNQHNFPLDIMDAVIPEFFAVETVFEAEKLRKQVGDDISEPSASNATARVGRTGFHQPGFLTYGSYYHLTSAGTYKAKFHIKVADNTVTQPVATLDILSNKTEVLAQRTLNSTDFAQTSSYQTFELMCNIPKTYPREIHELEFRVYFTGQTDVWVDYVEFLPVADQ